MKRSLCIITLLLFSLTGFAQDQEAMKTFDPNYVHTVFFWLNNPEDEKDRTAFETSLKKFLNTSKYAKTDFIGIPPKATRDVVDDSFTYKLIVSFESAEAQENYQNEEAHLLFIEECKDLWKKVIVYDAQELKQTFVAEFRNARLDDAENIAALHARNWQLNYRGILDDHYLDHQVEDDRRTVWKERLAQADSKLLLIMAEEENELVGFACLFYDDDPKYGALLDNLHVGVAHSGKGIGQQLIRKLAAEIQVRGDRQDMYLWVLKDNTGAIRLYERLGGQRKEQLLERELGNEPVEKIRYYWPDVSTLILP